MLERRHTDDKELEKKRFMRELDDVKLIQDKLEKQVRDMQKRLHDAQDENTAL